MRPVFPFPGAFTAFVLAALLVLVLFAMRVVQPEWYASRAGRRAVKLAFGSAFGGILLVTVGRIVEAPPLARLGAAVAYVGLFAILPAALILPLAAGLDRAGAWLLARRRSAKATSAGARIEARVSRREMLRFGTAALPAAAALRGAGGFLEASRAPGVRVVPLEFPELHADLEGLRILQLSDLHLGACLGLADLERALATAKGEAPDLVVVTGDLADDRDLIPDALRMIAGLGCPLGALAILGNHEYLHDIDVVRPLFEASPVPLLVDRGRTLEVGDARLFIAGADDPISMRRNIDVRLAHSIASAAAAAPQQCDFRLLLCHRPEGFQPATEHGFDLTLSGHTHGGQLGLFGRSLLDRLRPGVGWWGTYARPRPDAWARRRGGGGAGGPSRLYTTSGFGHWFPFRVGCPTEMPLLVLGSGRQRRRPGWRRAV